MHHSQYSKQPGVISKAYRQQRSYVARIGNWLAIDEEKEAYSNYLSSLQVQSKLQASLDLETEAPIWKRILWAYHQVNYSIRESVDSLCRDGAGPPIVCVHWKSVLTRERSCSKPFCTPSCPIPTFLYPMIPPR